MHRNPNTTSPFLKRMQVAMFGIQGSSVLIKIFTTIVLSLGAVFIFVPVIFMVSTSLKDRNMLRLIPPPLLPYEFSMVEVNGKEEPLFEATVDGQTRNLALIKNLPGGKAVHTVWTVRRI